MGRAGYYLVQYKPRILDADDEFLLEFPEVRGRPWPLTDWLVTIELTRNGWKLFLEEEKRIVCQKYKYVRNRRSF